MGYGESACIYIGIKIKISTLIKQINDENFHYIKQMLLDGEFENSQEENKLHDIVKIYLKNNNSKKKKDKKDEEDEEGEENDYEDERFIKSIKDIEICKTALKKLNSYNDFLLIPNEKHIIIENDAYWDECGSMSVSRDLDFDINAIKNDIDNECKKYIKGYKIVMILNQSGG
jgi:hypothetical protein